MAEWLLGFNHQGRPRPTRAGGPQPHALPQKPFRPMLRIVWRA